MDGDGDDFMLDGLACPPLKDYAFNLDTSFTPDDIIDDLLLQVEEKDDEEIVAKYFKQDEELDKMVATCLAKPPTPPSCLLDYVHAKFVERSKSCKITTGKSTIGIRPCGKWKEIKVLGQVLQVGMHN